MTEIQEMLFARQDALYGDFQAKLIPTIPREQIIGVRVPNLRKLAKELIQTPEANRFLNTLPHRYYDENVLHGLLIAEIKDYASCVEYMDRFLPYVDNWAVCDIMSPKAFHKHRTELLEKIRTWSASSEIYICRFGLEMLMTHFLDQDFQPELLEIPAVIQSTEYYVNMMLAWFFATALAKQWESAIPYLEEKRLGQWVHNKTIQKSIESYRITEEQKAYLRSLKIK